MWKRWFYFSRTDRQVITVLFVATVCLIIISWLYSNKKLREQDTHAQELEQFAARVAEAERARKKKYLPTETQSEVTLFPFDPNRIDAEGLTRLGLSSFVTNNIIKYRNKGGKFRQPTDLKRIYGLSQAQYEQLAPYITIAPAPVASQPTHTTATVSQKTAPVQPTPRTFYTEKYPEGTIIDLNATDTTELKKIPGIGSYYANKIMHYGHTLGGYANIGQLKEIDGLPADIERWFTIGTPPSPSLHINQWSVERLRRHPYLSFYQARVIVEHRHKYGRITSLSDLSLYPEFTENDLHRLEPYVSYD